VHAFDLAKPATVRFGRDIAARLGVPFVLTPSSAREVWPNLAFGDQACAAADLVLALSPAEIDDLALPDRARARLVGQGPCLADAADPAAFRRQLPGAGPAVLFLGRRSWLKGLDALALAAPLVWRSVPAALFAVAGPPGDADAQVAALRDPRFVDLGEVDLHGKTDALAGCTLLCLPSRADVFPLVFVEAWTLGRPVVSGDFRGVADVVRDGVDGLVCMVRPESLADALVTLLSNAELGHRLGAAGQRRAASELTWQAAAGAVESCYDQLSANRQSTAGRPR
jgi:glycosyltransferase involved in cell wall biosynthesis